MAQAKVSQVAVLPGFEHISRSWYKKYETYCARVMPGEFYVTPHNEMISTVLGSCVAACIRDPRTGFGGINHFMLPGSEKARLGGWGKVDMLETRFGVAAMESLINEVLKSGCKKSDLEIKLFGGGEILNMQNSRVGARNIEFVTNFLIDEGYRLASEDLGGQYPRKIAYFPGDGTVLVRKLRKIHTATIVAEENKYVNEFAGESTTGSIELFD